MLPSATVDIYWREMAKHRINQMAWMNTWDSMTGIGLTISNDTERVILDTEAFDINIEKLLALGYRDFKMPVPGCSNGCGCSQVSCWHWPANMDLCEFNWIQLDHRPRLDRQL